MLTCDKCRAQIPPKAKFCPECGDPVTAADKRSAIASEGGSGEALIVFGRSSSSGYERAVSICSKLPSYSVTGEGNDVMHQVVIPLTEIELIATVFDIVGSWKSSRMRINGQPATKRDLAYKGLGCFRAQQKAYSQAQFCFGERIYDANIWGCKRLNMPLQEWGGGWIDYGHIDSRGVWRWDKDRIRHDLEAGMSENGMCPLLDRKRVLDTLERLPEAIDPRTDPRWEYRTEDRDMGGGRYQTVAIGIRPVIQESPGYVLGDFKPQWEDDVRSEPEPVVVSQTHGNLDQGAQPAMATQPITAGHSIRSDVWLWVAVIALGIWAIQLLF